MTLAIQLATAYVLMAIVSWVVIGCASGFNCDHDYAIGGAIVWPVALVRAMCKWVVVYWKGSKQE